MEAKEFIMNELELFIKQFTMTRVRYEYDKFSSVHFVEVVPNEIYHFDDEYLRWEDDVYERFVSQFPTQTICFISDDDPVSVEYPELILEGLNYVIPEESHYDEEFVAKINQAEKESSVRVDLTKYGIHLN